MIIYLVICEHYQEPSIEVAYTKEELAKEYAELQNKKYGYGNAWYVTTLEVRESL